MVDTLVTSYQRVPPPSDPESNGLHLDGELQKLERTTRETIAKLAAVSTTYAPIDSPVLTGDPKAPTPLTADNDTSIATTAFVKAQDYATHTDLTSGLAPKADSSALSGYATTGALTTGLAGKADTTALASYAPLASPALTGTPTAPTPSSGDNSTKLATTAYADAANPWSYIKRTAAQTVTTQALTDDNTFTFAMLANTTYAFRFMMPYTSTSGGLLVGLTGPASPVIVHLSSPSASLSAYGSSIILSTAASAGAPWFSGLIQNGPNAGNAVVRIGTGNASGGSTNVEKGAYLEYRVS